MTEIQEQMMKDLQECPIWIVSNSVSALKTILDENTINQIREAYNNDSENWYVGYHFGWGMKIRNFLRDNVCLDDQLPTGNFDDYYIQFVELVCELRSL